MQNPRHPPNIDHYFESSQEDLRERLVIILSLKKLLKIVP